MRDIDVHSVIGLLETVMRGFDSADAKARQAGGSAAIDNVAQAQGEMINALASVVTAQYVALRSLTAAVVRLTDKEAE
jgi:hypothetical protein